MEENQGYNLYSSERIYRDFTLFSYYFQRNKKIIKKYSPVDIDGERYRLNLETGEIENYKKQDILTSYGASLRRTKICMNMLLSMNDFDWFWTLTFDKEKIDRKDDKAVFECYKKYINNLKHKFSDFKYMCFPERHEDGCFHFHLLVAGLTIKQMGLVDSGKVCCHWAKKVNKKSGKIEKLGISSKSFFDRTKHLHVLKDTDGEPIYNITTFAYGYTTASRICSRERCNSYVKKYVEKALGSTEIFKKRFYYSSNLNTPEIVKTLVGADFDHPTNIEQLDIVQHDPFVLNAFGKGTNKYGVFQFKINNSVKEMLKI